MDDPIQGDPSAAPPTPAQLAANPSLMDRNTDFGEETATCDLEDRDFSFGEEVKIEGKAVVLDKERRNEGMTDIEVNPETGERNPNYVPLDKREVLECDVTGMKGTLQNGSYWSEEKQCYMAPVELNRGGLVYVDERKLERASRRPNGKVSVGFSGGLTRDEEILLVEYRKQQAEKAKKFLESFDKKEPS